MLPSFSSFFSCCHPRLVCHPQPPCHPRGRRLPSATQQAKASALQRGRELGSQDARAQGGLAASPAPVRRWPVRMSWAQLECALCESAPFGAVEPCPQAFRQKQIKVLLPNAGKKHWEVCSQIKVTPPHAIPEEYVIWTCQWASGIDTSSFSLANCFCRRIQTPNTPCRSGVVLDLPHPGRRPPRPGPTAGWVVDGSARLELARGRRGSPLFSGLFFF